jgi:LEA14-like dessication related protein
MSKKSCVAFISAAMIIFLCGCETLQQVLDIQKPTAQLAGVKFGSVSLEGAQLVFDVDIDNPYPAPLPLLNIDYGLTSKDSKLFSGSADLDGTIPAKSNRTVSLPVTIKYLDIVKAFKGVRPGSAIPYKADIGLSLDTPALGKLRLPLGRQGTLNVPDIPKADEIDLQRILLDKITPK